jgi:hypothetical protein
VETAAQVASQVARARLLGLPNDYVQTYRQKLAAVTPAQLQAAAAAGIKRDGTLIVIVGDGAKIYDKLKAIAPVRLISTDGASLTPADLTAKPKGIDLDLSALTAQSDSFTVLYQGNAIGAQTSKLEKLDGGWRYTESTAIPMAGMQQSTVVTFTDKIVMQETHQSGTAGGQQIKVDLVYAGARVKGKAVTPSQAGPKTVDIDAEMPAGAIDDNAFSALVAAMAWGADAKLNVAAFQGGKGALAQLTLNVIGEEKVKVPAGEFDAFKVDFQGGETPVTLYVSKAKPFRILKIVPSGMPVSFERAR